MSVREPRLVCYLAHRVGAPTANGIAENLASVRRWMRYLHQRYPDRAFIAPYLTWIETCGDDDHDPAARARGLDRDCAVVEHCDEFWPVGCGPSGACSVGMAIEYAVAREALVLPRLDYLHHVEPPTAEGA